MPVALTSPGVYIEEIASGIHAITAVATSTAAFLGYTTRGPVDKAVELFSFADFDQFGGLSADSPLSYAVSQFYQNGGTTCYVVRIADGATATSLTLPGKTAASFKLWASSAGLWGNNVAITIDSDTVAGANYFNLTATEFVTQNGTRAAKRSETFRNCSMNPIDPGYVLAI